MKIKDTKQILFRSVKELLNGQKESIYLIPELLLLTGIEEDLKNNELLKRQMIDITKLSPDGKIIFNSKKESKN